MSEIMSAAEARAVVGVFADRGAAEVAIDALHQAGFASDHLRTRQSQSERRPSDMGQIPARGVGVVATAIVPARGDSMSASSFS